MSKKITQLVFIISLAFITKNVNSQITYIDLSVSQPNVEDCITNIKTNFQHENLNVFPNPSKGIFNINIKNINSYEKLKITIYNINGQLIFSEKINLSGSKFNHQINLSKYSSGTYLLNITLKNKYYNAEIFLK